MKKIYLPLIALLCLCLLAACEIINPPEALPAYIQIEPFEFSTNLDQGSASNNITDAWLYVDNELIGAFTLPATVPVLKTGEFSVIVDPGIKENGVAATPTIYPYYQRYTNTVNLVETEITTIQPESAYNDNLNFVFIEGFTDQHLFTADLDGNPETSIVSSSLGAYEGNSGRIELTTEHPRLQVATGFVYDNLPTDGSVQIYLEMDYKNAVNLGVGVIGVDANGIEKAFYSHGLNPTAEWKKVYINLTEVIFNSELEYYQITFAATLPDGLDSAVILVDNIKLIHFEQ